MPIWTTGTEASGRRGTSTDQVPWSRPHSLVEADGHGARSCWISRARAGLPGAGYRTSYSSRGKPPKSWIVRGARIAVTHVPGRYQWADTTTMAVGRGSARPMAAQASVYALLLQRVHRIAVPEEERGHGGPGSQRFHGVGHAMSAISAPSLLRRQEPERPAPRVFRRERKTSPRTTHARTWY